MTEDLMILPHQRFIEATRAEFEAMLIESDFDSRKRCGECSFECVSDLMLEAHYNLKHA